MIHGLGVRARGLYGLVVIGGVLNTLLDVTSLALVRHAHGGLAGDRVERRLNRTRVARERKANFHAAIECSDHRLVTGTQDILREILHLLEHAIAVEGHQRQVVDVEDHSTPQVLRNLLAGHCGRRRARNGGDRNVQRFRTFHFVEVRDFLRYPIFIKVEVVVLEAGDRVSLLVGDHDIDVDHADVDGLGEFGDLGRWLLLRDERGGAECDSGGTGSEKLQRHSSVDVDDPAPSLVTCMRVACENMDRRF